MSKVAVEKEGAITIVSIDRFAEARRGAARFASGKGRGGDFGEI